MQVMKVIRRAQVAAVTGLSKATIYRYMDKGIFPRPIPLGERGVGWIEEEVMAWLVSRVQARDELYGTV